MRNLLKFFSKYVPSGVKESVLNLYEFLFGDSKGRYPVVIQGIQRSGTNYLTAVLMSSDYRVLNKIDPKRSNPRHKHCRWQNDKTTIVMDDRYRNESFVTSIAEINAICGYPENQKHIVIFRSPDKWLGSIYRWGLESSWFNDEEDFFNRNLHWSYLQEWDAYYDFWQRMALQSPEQVLFVSHERLVKQTEVALERINKFMGVVLSTELRPSISIEKVRHSKPITEKRVSLQHPELTILLNKPLVFDWRCAAEGSD